MEIITSKIISRTKASLLYKKYYNIYNQFRNYTMIPPNAYVNNLLLVEKYKDLKGAVVECGTWKGGMIGGIAKLLNDKREYHLFDSFEGLPEAKEIDGIDAVKYQENKESKWYHDNCRADVKDAEDAMKISGASQYKIHKGWFEETLINFKGQISILRLDGDWYDSTLVCLNELYNQVVSGGIIIIDDYYTWEGCTKAVHDFLSKENTADTIRQFRDEICYIQKK